MASFNDAEDLVLVTAAQTLFQMIVAAVGEDGRRFKRPRETNISVRNNTWENVEAGSNDGWYRANLRVNRATFDSIVEMVEDYMDESGIETPAVNAFVDLRMQVAMTLKYLAQEAGFQGTAAIFGVSKATTVKAINRILDVLFALSPSVIW
jgi:hypothetical protein